MIYTYKLRSPLLSSLLSVSHLSHRFFFLTRVTVTIRKPSITFFFFLLFILFFFFVFFFFLKKSNVYNFAIFFNLENCFRDLNLYDCENTTKATTNSGGSSSTSGRGRSQTFYCSSGCFEEFYSNKQMFVTRAFLTLSKIIDNPHTQNTHINARNTNTNIKQQPTDSNYQ